MAKHKFPILLTLAPALALSMLSVFTASAGAHHGGTHHDNTKVTVLNGTVASFEFVNPHILISIDVKDARGNIQHWTVEYTSPHVASQEGWSRDMMKAGDQIVYDVHPAKNGSFSGRGAGQMQVNGKRLGNRPDF